MGYLSSISVDVAIREEYIEAVRDSLAKAKRARKDDFRQYFLKDLTIDDDGMLEFLDHTHRKWYHDQEFADWLKKYCTAGTITFLGEDGLAWGHEFDGQGRVRHLKLMPESDWE